MGRDTPINRKPLRSSDDAGGNPNGSPTSPMNAVTARGDGFRNALTVYGNGAQDLAGNLGPITANSGTMEYTRNLLDQKTRMAVLSDSLLQAPRAQSRTLMEIDSAMRDDQLALERDAAEKENRFKRDAAFNNKDIFDVSAEVLTTTVGLYKGARAITKGFGDEEMAYDKDKWKEEYDNYIAQAKKQGIDLDNMDPEEAMQYYEFFNNRALEIAKGSDANLKLTKNPAGWVADKIGDALEIIPGLKKLRQTAVATAEAERLAEKSRATPEMVDATRRMVQNHFEKEGKSREEAAAYFNLLRGAVEASAAANGLSLTDGFNAMLGPWASDPVNDFTGPPSPGTLSFGSGFVASFTPVVPAADPGVPGAPGKPAPIDFGGSEYTPLFSLIVKEEAGMFGDPFNAFNRGDTDSAFTNITDSKGETIYRTDAIGNRIPIRRVIQAEEVWQKKITDMSVEEVQSWMVSGEPGKEIKAAGAIQATEIFLKDAVANGIVKPRDMMDNATQLRLAAWSMEKRPDIGAYLQSDSPSKNDRDAALTALSREYETFVDPTTGYSAYDTRGKLYDPSDPNSKPKRATVSNFDAIKALEEVRNARMGKANPQMSESPGQAAANDQRVMNVLSANKDKNFVKRILQPDKEREFITVEKPDGTAETRSHNMRYASVDDNGKKRWAVYPEVMPEAVKRNGAVAGVDFVLKDYGQGGWDEAKNRKEYILFDDQAEAKWFSKNYKRLWGRK